MPKRKQPPVDPPLLRLENVLETQWQFRVNLTEADVRVIADGRVPEWLQSTAAFWTRDNPKPSDIMPKDCAEPEQEAEHERKTA